MEKFRTRHNIAFRAISGEAASVNPKDVATFLTEIPSIINNYSRKNIYNADETGLFFRAVPNKTLHLKRERCIGGKFSKERLTVLFCVNMEGEKEIPLVIGKTAKPRAFKHINVNDLPVTWRWNKKAWMTGELMAEWLMRFDGKMIREKRKILLFLDNACSHPRDIQLQNIKLIFLPPNCTSVVQPLDQGIIKSFKGFYRTFIIKKLLIAINTAETAQELSKKIHVLDAIYFIKNAWDRVTKNTIQNCFIKSGITHSNNSENRTDNPKNYDNEDDIPLSILAEILRNKDNFGVENDNDIEDFFNVDNNVICEETEDPARLEIPTQEIVSDESDDEQTQEEQGITTYQQAINMTQQLKRFVEAHGDLSALDLLSKLDLHLHDSLINKKTRQTSLLEYFK